MHCPLYAEGFHLLLSCLVV